MQPGGQRLAATNGTSLPKQHKKCRLKGIFRVGLLAQLSAASAEHHRAVSPQQQLKRGCILMTIPALEQLSV
jgi:hypothetical protein